MKAKKKVRFFFWANIGKPEEALKAKECGSYGIGLIHNLVHTVIYFVLLPIFVLSIVGIPFLILPAISFTLVFLSFKGVGEYIKKAKAAKKVENQMV